MFKIRASPALVAIFQTVNINLLVFALGCLFGLTGATLIDLGDIYLTSPKIVSYIITSRGVGSIVFCLVGGVIFHYFNMQKVLIVSLLVAAIGLGMTPLWGDLTVCHVFTFFVGGAIGLMETGSNFWLCSIWKEKSGPLLQFLNFCFGLGGVVAPFVAAPFLSKVHSMTNATVANSSDVEILPYTADTQVFVPYLFLGGIFGLTFVLFVITYLMDSSNISVSDTEANDSCGSHGWQLTMVATYCLYVLSIVALEQTYISMLALFVVQQLNFTKSNSVYVSAVFWIFFTSSRVVATLASFRMRPRNMLIICHTLVIVAAAGLCLKCDAPATVWICSAIMGFGVSPMFATALTHTLQFIHLNQTYTAIVMLCVCTGGMLPPVLVGPFIENAPIAFVYINLIITLLSGGLVLAIFLLPKGKSVRPTMLKK